MGAPPGWYVPFWISFCLLAMGLAYRDRMRLLPEWSIYRRFLFIPSWKPALFVPPFLVLAFGGRFTDDETWDAVTGAGMSILTFVTAPWALGAAYQALAGKRPWRDLILSAALALFSASWFYDGYLLLRDGVYTRRWLGNLILSSITYVAAGLFWNLEAKVGGIRLSFMRPDWPTPPADKRFGPIIVFALPLALIAAWMIVGFVRWRF